MTLPRTLAKQMDRFVGRAWLLPRLLEWWNAGSERVFLLTGGPGTGKSMIQAWLCGFGPEPEDPEARSQLERLRAATVAAHFFQAASRNISPQSFGESIANQLAANVAGFAAALAATLAERVQIVGTAHAGLAATGAQLTGVSIERIDLGTLGDEQSFDRAFSQPLKRIYTGESGGPILLLVDALDEAQTYTGSVTLPDLLSRVDDLPAQVRILATTRNEPRVLKHFRGTTTCDLVADADPSIDDVRDYARSRLAAGPALEASRRERFASRLALAADGVFLYAAMVLDDLQGRDDGDLPELEQVALPDGLGGLYHEFLRRELGRDDRNWFEIYEPLLGLMAVARGPGLTSKQLSAITGRDVRAALRTCRQYLDGELPDGPFRPFHKSFSDFLLEHPENVDFRVDALAMHARIADHYWSNHRVDWSTCDDYGLDNLATHLRAAGQFDRLTSLISPEWMEQRVKRAGHRYSGFGDDLAAAWRPAQEAALQQIERRDAEWDGFARCFRLALLRCSINSLASRVSPDLVVMAVKSSVWPIERAIDVVQHTADPFDRLHLCLSLLADGSGFLTAEFSVQLKQSALAAVRAIKDPTRRVTGLIRMAQHDIDGEHSSIVEEAVSAVLSIGYAPERANAAAELAPLLDPTRADQLLGSAVEATRTIADPEDRVYAYRALLTRLNDPVRSAVAAEALSAATSIVEAQRRADALSILACSIDGPLSITIVDQAAAAARELEDPWRRAWGLMQLMRLEGGPDPPEVLAAARLIVDDGARAGVLGLMASALEGEARQAVAGEACAAARASNDPRAHAMELAELARHLEGDARRDALNEATLAALDLVDAGERARTLLIIASQLDEPMKARTLREALEVARQIADADGRARFLTEIAESLDGDARRAVVQEALEAARGLDDAVACAIALSALVAQASVSDRSSVADAALNAARAIWSHDLRCAVLVELARESLGDSRQLALQLAEECARAETDPVVRTQNLALVAAELTGSRRASLLREALETARHMDGHGDRGEALVCLAPLLPDDDKRTVLHEALRAARATRNEIRRTVIIQALIPHLDTGPPLEAIRPVAGQITHHTLRATALIALLDRGDNVDARGLTVEILEAARAIVEPGNRARKLARAARSMEGEPRAALLDDARAAALACEDPVERSLAHVEITELETGQSPIDATLVAALTLASDRDRARLIGAIAPRLAADTQRDAALEAAMTITGAELRLECLRDLWRCDRRQPLVDGIRRCLLEFLDASMTTSTRAELLRATMRREFTCPPVVSAGAAGEIARDITEIREKWCWL